jgi:hypothetical protein
MFNYFSSHVFITIVDPEKLIEDHLRVGQKLIEDEVKRQEDEDEMLVR